MGVIFRSLLPTVLVYAALVGWGYLSLQIVDHAPSGRVTKSLTVSVAGTPKTLGRQELGQRIGPRSAAIEQLLIKRDGNGWAFGNKSTIRRTLLTTSRFKERFVQRWEIKKGDRISFVGAEILVVDVSDDRLVLRERKSGRTLTWDGELQLGKDKVTTVCNGLLRRKLNWAKWVSRGWFGTNKPEVRLFTIGGGVNCTNRWKITSLPPAAAGVTWLAGKFWVAPGALRAGTLMYRSGSSKSNAFVGLTVSANGSAGKVQSLILGQTRYRVKLDSASVRLSPLANRDFFFADQKSPPNSEARSWIGAGEKALDWVISNLAIIIIGLIAGGGAAVGAFIFWVRGKGRSVGSLLHIALAVIPAVAGIWVTLQLARSAGDPDQGLIVGMAWLAWFWATFLLVWAGRLQGFAGWIWLGGVMLAAIGTSTLFQLGAGADNTRWLGFYYKHAALLALFAWAIALFSAVPDRIWLKIWLFIFNRERVVFGFAAVLIGGMVLQFFLGSEEGIAGLQPVELVKTVFVVLLGFVGLHVTEARRREARAYRESPIKFLMPYFRFAAVFFLFIGAIVVGVRDFSPLVIMTVVLATWLWKLGGSQDEFYRKFNVWKIVRPLVLVGVAGFIGLMAWVYNNPTMVPDGFPQKDRILVWAQPDLHPHSGSQVLKSMDLVGAGSWYGSKPWYGVNGKVMELPAVQDDFITAFLINRFGGIAGLAMLITQLFYILLLFGLGRAVERKFQEGDFREQNAGVVLGYTLYGLAWMHVAHWLISWGNTLGMLPVMGQPMTWLTAGNSHLVAFALVILFVSLVTGWISLAYSEETREEKRAAKPRKKGNPPKKGAGSGQAKGQRRIDPRLTQSG